MVPDICRLAVLVTAAAVVPAASGSTVASTPAARARDAFAALFGSSVPPPAFRLGDRSSAEVLPGWRHRVQSKRLSRGRRQAIHTYRDAASGLTLSITVLSYADYPVVEWTAALRNEGTQDTPILSDLRSIDARFARGTSQEFTLHHNRGSQTAPTDFEPLAETLGPGARVRLASSGGRPMSLHMPYFGLEWGSSGLLMALSWVGDWAADFVRDDSDGLRIVAGLQTAHFRLHPGEEARLPLVALMFWVGCDRIDAHNLWRRWMVDHNLPRPGGRPFPVVLSGAMVEQPPAFICSADDEVALIRGHAAHDLPITYWWRDAGWYPCGGQWWNTGTWEPDPARYPQGLRPVADAAHAEGLKMTLWFEPERAVPGSWLYANHPEWLVGPDGGQKLLNLGLPEAREWLVAHVDRLMTENRIDMYRQDFNVDPAPYWRHGEATDRVGINENRYVLGLLAYWDALAARRPGMPFDNCAGGGTRNVLEMMRRGVPLSKTDYAGGTTSSQCQLMGLAPWLPYFGAGAGQSEALYTLRSNMAPWIGFCYDTRKDTLNYALLRAFFREHRDVAPLYYGDFYPLTPYSQAEDVWAAWQFHDYRQDRGVVQAFRRPAAKEIGQTFRLRGLSPQSRYEVRDRDGGPATVATGGELMEQGLTIATATAPEAKVVMYRKVR